ncbi:MAG: hypothetical protein AB7L09_03075 [Nitrospira sp.]
MGDWNLDFYYRPLSKEPEFRLTENMLRNANIGRNYWDCSIEQIPDQCDYKGQLKRLVSRLPRDVRAGRGAVFWGNHGFGKTAAADILLKAAMARGGQCYHRIACSIEHVYNKRWVETNLDGIEIWDVLTKVQVLVIDDLGTELSMAGFKAGDTRIIEELLRARYDERLPTYITTNLPIDGLTKHYQPINSILADTSRYESVHVTGHYWRDGEE